MKIDIYLNKNANNLLANADITIDDVEFGSITIKHFQIWKSQFPNKKLFNDYINITPPSNKNNSSAMPCDFVHLEDKDKWFELITQIYEAYLNENRKE